MSRRTLLVLAVAVAGCVAAGLLVILSGPAQNSAPDGQGAESLEEVGEGEGEMLRAPSDGVICCNGEPAYDSTNTDGQEGSGNGAVAYRAGGQSVRQLSRPDPRLFRTGYGAWEPTLGVTSAGTVFYAGRNSNVDPVALRSRDQGRTWTAVPPVSHKSSLDPYMWVDPSTERVFTSDLGPTVTCSPLSFTDDEGENWTTNPVCGETDHQNVFGGSPPDGGERPSGYPNVVYFCAISGGALASTSTATACSKSLDGGSMFLPTGEPAYPPRVAEDGTFCDGAAGHGAVGPDGTVYVPRGWGEECRRPYVAISDDEGATWTRVEVSDIPLPEGAHEAGVAVDEQGNVFFSWVSEHGHPYVAVSRDGGLTWGQPWDVLPPGVDRVSAFTASIDAGGPGAMAAVFMGTEDPQGTSAEDTTWNGYLVTSSSALRRKPTFIAASINDPETNPLWKGKCGSVRCGNIGDFLDVVIGPDGTPWAAMVDSCPGADNRCTDFAVATPRGEGIVGQLVGGRPLR